MYDSKLSGKCDSYRQLLGQECNSGKNCMATGKLHEAKPSAIYLN